MRKLRGGFRLAKRVASLCRWRRRFGYRRLDPTGCPVQLSRLRSWGRRVAAFLSSGGPLRGPGKALLPDPEVPPKGHLAVYVGRKDGVGDFQRVLVPVVYFNHPLFGELLRDAEEEYGFHHSGGITIPCRISEFESVQTRIAAINGGIRSLVRRRLRR